MGPQRKVDTKRILAMKQQGMTIGEVARITGYGWRTVKKVFDINLEKAK